MPRFTRTTVAVLFGGALILTAIVTTLAVARRPAAVSAAPAAASPPLRLPALPARETPQSGPFRFSSVGQAGGIDFVYYGSPTPQRAMTEQNGGGVALLDFDGDGELDIFLPNGSDFKQPAAEVDASQHLYRAQGGLRFMDATQAAGIQAFGFGMGCAAGDYDNDGFADLYVPAYGVNRLWHNNGDGTFSETTEAAGVGEDQWGTSAAFADLDSDGDLDLYVVNYVQWSPSEPPCYTQHQPNPVHISCGPLGRAGQPDVLYENQGDGSFADVSQSAGVALPDGKGLDLVIADFDEDGRLDIYVANDTTENHLFRNLGGLRFEEVGVARGAAVSQEGVAQSGMGIACGDYNGDGHLDLSVTNFENEVNDFYENLGGGNFRTVNAELGLNSITRPLLGFGMVLADFDLDHRPDLFIANGHVWDLRPLGLDHAYEMPPLLAQNVGGRRFRDVSRLAGEYFQERWLGRAVATGDLDNDGDPDLVVTHLSQPPGVLRNDSHRAGGSLRLKLVGRRSAREPRGARVEAVIDGETWVTCIPAGGGYQASSDARVLIATGAATVIEALRVTWSAESVEVWTNLPVQPSLTLLEGSGEPVVEKE
jgi:hypothetical protein